MHLTLRAGALALACAGLAACGVEPSEARRVLQRDGYSEIRLDGYSWNGCVRGEPFNVLFHAKNARGAIVDGVLCGGPFTGYAIRTF